jgi:hypothetical protein
MTQSDFESIFFPIDMQVASKTISQQIVFATKDEIDEVKSRVIRDNRDGKLGSIMDGIPFTEQKLENDPEYKELMSRVVIPMSSPSSNIFYLDFQYGTASL